jgi:two-component system, NarL family, nitrate/nitrite response regulator NarL
MLSIESASYSRRLPTVLVISDVRLYRDGLAGILTRTGRYGVVRTASSADAENNACPPPDVVLIEMPMLTGVRRLMESQSFAGAKVIAFAASDVENDALSCAALGASGLVGPDASAEDIANTIEGYC